MSVFTDSFTLSDLFTTTSSLFNGVDVCRVGCTLTVFASGRGDSLFPFSFFFATTTL